MRISDWSADVCSSDLSAPHRRGATLLGLHVCRSRQLYRARLAHFRLSLFGLPAGVDQLCARRRDLRQFLRTSLVARYSLVLVRGDRAAVLALSGLVPPAPRPPPHAFARRLGSGRSEEHTSELQSLMRISYAVF